MILYIVCNSSLKFSGLVRLYFERTWICRQVDSDIISSYGHTYRGGCIVTIDYCDVTSPCIPVSVYTHGCRRLHIGRAYHT